MRSKYFKTRLNLLGMNFYTTQRQTAVICLFPAKITLWREMSEFRVETSYARWKRKLHLLQCNFFLEFGKVEFLSMKTEWRMANFAI